MTINYTGDPFPLSEHQYAIIDRMRVPELPKCWPLIELVSPMLAPQAHLYPWLVPLNELPYEELRVFMAELSQCDDELSQPKCSLLLSSTSPVQVVRNALVNALYFKDKQQNGHILRYYDPRVLFHLHWMLNPWQLLHQLSGREIPHWTFFLEGKWHSLALPEHVPFPPGSNVELPLEQLQRVGLINLALEKYSQHDDMSERQRISGKIDALLVQANKCGLISQGDCIAFALHGLSQEGAFWAAPAMTALLDQARQGPDFYCDVTSGWDEAHWLEVKQGKAHQTGWNH